MNTCSNILFDDWLERCLADPEIQAAIKEQEAAYQAERLRIMWEIALRPEGSEHSENEDEVRKETRYV